MRTIREQLYEVFEASGMSMSELARRCGIERSKLTKRINNKHALKTGAGASEPESIARALGGRLVFVPTRKRAA